MKIYPLLFLTLLSTGCVNKYIPPQDSNVATINFSAQSDSIDRNPFVITYIVSTYDDLNCSEPKEIGKDLFSELNVEFNDIKVAAGKPFVFGIRYSESTKYNKYTYCSSLNSFIPVQGEKYQAHYQFNNKQESCDVTVTESTSNGKKNVELQRPARTCFTDFSRNDRYKNGVATTDKPQKTTLTTYGTIGSPNMIITVTPN